MNPRERIERIERVGRDDPRVAPYTSIRERDLVGRRGRFIAEGLNVLKILLSPRSLYRPESILVSENRERVLSDLSISDSLPVYSMKQDDIDAIVGFHIHRGILAIGLRDPTTSTSTSTPTSTSTVPPPITIALMGIVNHDNVGGIFRNAAAFGAARIVMDDVTCDPLYRKAIRVSVGGALIVPFERFLSAEAMLQWLHDTNIETLALSPAGNERLTDMTPSRPTAILLGPEGPGLPKEVLARLRTVRIPIVSTFDSLNVSVACGIALAHLCARAL